MDATGLTDELQGLVKGIGQAFFFSAYLPALFFVALHQYVLLPALGLPNALLPDMAAIPLLSGELLTTLLLPFLLAMLLVSLNTTIVRFFEGLLPWQRAVLLRPWQRINEQKCRQLYGQLQELKAEYLDLLTATSEAEETGAEDAQALFGHLNQTAERIQAMHEQIESTNPVQTLPFRTHFVCPTALGNTFAVSEEYPLDRYGMDAVLFWPRLRQVVDDRLLSLLDNLKMFLDFQLNLSTLALIFATEATTVEIIRRAGRWWLIAALALLVAWLNYKASVRVARAMGTLMNTCFDYFRKDLLEHFGLTQPADFFEEYKTWLRLGAFLRRGALLFWPGEL